jgi:MFS transporter, SP family, solute carrier family 2 (myo-inositol transporter), member 13
MLLSGLVFVVSIPMIANSNGYNLLLIGRLLQGMSGGFIGVVVPLYLAECLVASKRGKGTGIFQWLLTFGIACAALIGVYFSYRVDIVAHTSSAAALLAFKDHAWRQIFWVSLPPGVLFVLGALFVSESPRWLYMRGKHDRALAALLRSRSPEQANIELGEIKTALAATTKSSVGAAKDSLLSRRYVIPFVLACVILFCNTATGVNSIIGYNTNILLQAGLSDIAAHWGYVLFTIINFLMTIIAMMLVDKKGRKFLLTLGTSGIIVSMLIVGTLFRSAEKQNIDASAPVQSMVTPDQNLNLTFDAGQAQKLLTATNNPSVDPANVSFAIIYSYGDFTGATAYVTSRDNTVSHLTANRSAALPANKIEAFFSNPFANLDVARSAPLVIQKAVLSPIPGPRHGWAVAIWLYIFMSFFAVGPGVCVWLALSELMPTRIRSNGMSIALVINQVVSTTLAGVFLPVVSKHGYSFMFFLFAGFTVIYFVTAVFFLPETKNKTLEEIEKHFEAA